MDINNSPLSTSKSNTSGASRKTLGVRSTSTTSAISDGKLSELRQGQILRGQIIDHRYQEVSIRLEPGNQIIKAGLAGDIPLTIGQDARFQVTGEVNEHLVLKYLPEETGAPTDSTVSKALSASGLPMTERNKALVSELLSRRMPVDKQTLLELIRVSNANREASPLTLVLMHKNNIPMTASNIRLFEAYQNGTVKLLTDIRTITGNLSELLTNFKAISTELPTNPDLGLNQQITHNPASNLSPEAVITGNSSLEEAIRTNGKLIDILYGNSTPDGSVTQGDLSNPQAPVTQGDLSNLQALKSQEILTNLQASVSEEVSSNPQAPVMQGDLSNLQAPVAQEGLSSLQTPVPDASDLLAQFANDTTIGNALAPGERATLDSLISSLPLSEELKNQISEGTASLHKVLTMLQEKLPMADKEAAQALLQAPEYRKLLEEAFHQKWTIPPESLAKKTPVSELYRNLQEDMEKLEQLIKKSDTADEPLQIREPVKNLQENLRFMKDLNEMFTYLQLPVQTKDQEIHSELYVLSRKEALRNKKDNFSVLLHLDMTNLGSLNIHIQMYNSLITAKFYMEDTPSRQLVTQNIPLLEDSLKKKGYELHAEMESTYVKPDFVQDFIEQNTQDNTIKNYTFDIRT